MDTRILDYDFAGAQAPPLVASRDGGPWCRFTAETGGTPTVKAADGYMKLYLDTTLENQLACLYMGDILPFDIDAIKQVDFWAKLGAATVPASVSLAFGLASARNNDPDSIAAHALFRCSGSGSVFCETDDGTNDNDDKSTGLTLGTTLKRFSIDFGSGVKTVVPPPNAGGKANVLFSMDDDNQNLRQVCRSTRFDMSNYSDGLQLFAQIQKGAASSVIAADVTAYLLIQRIRIRYQVGA